MMDHFILIQVAVIVVAAGAWTALQVAPTQASRLQRQLLLCVPLVLLAASFSPAAAPFTAPAQVFSPADGQAPYVAVAHTELGRIPTLPAQVPFVAFGLLLTLPALLGLARSLRGSRRMRIIHGVELRIAPAARTPFAVWLGHPIVVLDPDTAMDPALAEIAIRHELQHHRNRDPHWAWLLVALTAVSPFALLLRPAFAAAEELACDQAVTRRVSPTRYAQALLRLALRAPPTPLAAGFGGISLRWRLTMLLRPPTPSRPRTLLAAILVPFVLLVAAPVGWAADGVVAIHAWDEAAFTQAAAQLETTGLFGADHPRVRAAVERVLATPDRKKWTLDGLERARPLQGPLQARLVAAGLPPALAAVPLVESGYRNLRAEDLNPRIPASSRGAGYWMFIAATARNYGLRVDTVDERLDFTKETTAAIALLSADYARYGDWALALAAYNQGETAVDAAIAAGGTRDAFALADRGLLNDYVDQVYAAAVLTQAPNLLR